MALKTSEIIRKLLLTAAVTNHRMLAPKGHTFEVVVLPKPLGKAEVSHFAAVSDVEVAASGALAVAVIGSDALAGHIGATKYDIKGISG